MAGDMINIANLDTEQIGYFGKSSTINFVGHVQSILAESLPYPDRTSLHSANEAPILK